MLAGISAYVKMVRPEIKVIGVNSVDSDAMYQALHAGKPVELAETGLFADGTAVKQVGKECFKLCQKYVDDFVLVNNDEICAAIKDAFNDTRSILEASGALALAGLKKYLGANPQLKNGYNLYINDSVFVAITSGANINFHQLRFVAERARIGEGREAILGVLAPERPGGYVICVSKFRLKELYEIISPRFVTELSYRYHDKTEARLYISFEITDSSETAEIIQKLSEKGYKATDFSNNEVAKTHARYLVVKYYVTNTIGRKKSTGQRRSSISVQIFRQTRCIKKISKLDTKRLEYQSLPLQK